jgi:hypothetical protein
MRNYSFFLAFAAALSACASIDTAPAWVVKGASSFKPRDGVIFGIGKADNSILDEAVRIETADNRAHSNLESHLTSFMASLMKGYSGQDSLDARAAVHGIGIVALNKAEVCARFLDPSRTAYSLVKIDLSDFKRALEDSGDLKPEAKAHVLKWADSRFRRLEQKSGLSLN